MKQDTHPPYYPNAKITCACGASYQVGSTMEAMHVEICGNCHPFFTGKQKLVDTARRVEKFQERHAKATAKKAQVKTLKEEKHKREKLRKDEEETAIQATKEAEVAAKKMAHKVKAAGA